MNYNTVYEVLNERLDSFLFFPIAVIALGFGVCYISYKFFASGSLQRTYVIGLFFVIGLFALIFSIATIPSSLMDYYQAKKIYKEGNYKTIEEKIESFDPMPYAGHKQERFILNGIEFNYSDFSASYYGFHNSSSHGGPIKENGQEIRIGYITSDKGHNTILKIELKK